MLATPATLCLLIQVASASLTGVVQSQEGLKPLEGVTVLLLEAGVEAITDGEGRYTLGGLASGWHTLRFSRMGYRLREIRMRIPEAGASGLDVTLVVEPILLEPLKVEGEGPLPSGLGSERSSLLDDIGHHVTSPIAFREDPVALSSEPLEAITSLPEVAASPGTMGAFHVRGGSADQNLILLDGVPLLNPYHALGLGSALNPDVVSRMDFFSAVAPARFGGRLSSVLSLETRRPDPERHHVQGGLENYAGRITVDGPLPLTGGAFLASVRHSVEGPLAGGSEDGISRADFYDLLGKVAFPLAGGTLEAQTLTTGDDLDFRSVVLEEGASDPDLRSEPLNRMDWWSLTGSLRWRRPAPRETLVILWRSDADTGWEWDPTGSSLTMHNRLTHTGIKLERAYDGGDWEVRWGGEVQRYSTSYSVDTTDSPGRRDDARSSIWGGFGEVRIALGDRTGLSMGIRASDGPDLAFGTEPRASLRVHLGDRVTGGIGYARTRQEIQSRRNEESVFGLVAGIDLLALPAGDAPVATSDQLIASLTATPADGFHLSADVYYRKLRGLSLVAPETAEPFAVGDAPLGTGTARGLNVSLVREGERVRGRASYGLANVSRSVATLGYSPGFHRDQWLRAGLSVRLGRHLSLRTAVETGSGAPVSALAQSFAFESLDPLLGEGELSGSPRRVLGRLNDLAAPWYLRFDAGLRGEWHPTLGGQGGRAALFAYLTNLSNRANVLTYALTPEGDLTPVPFARPLLRAGIEWSY